MPTPDPLLPTVDRANLKASQTGGRQYTAAKMLAPRTVPENAPTAHVHQGSSGPRGGSFAQQVHQ